MTTHPEKSYAVTLEQLTSLAWKAAGAALAYAGCEHEDLVLCMEELEPTLDEFVIDLRLEVRM